LKVISVILLASILVVSGSLTLAYAVTTGFVNNPSSNSVDWTNTVNGFGGTVFTLDFDAHPLGALQGNFYAPQGVTLSTTGVFGNVVFGTGPNQANTAGNIPGEGPHPASNFLNGPDGIKTLTANFATPVCGAGLFTIDYFDNNSNDLMMIEAFTGPSGTGISLGSFSSINMNLQPDSLYFMGIADDTNSIRSMVFSYNGDPLSDIIGIDDIKFARCEVAVGGEYFTLDTTALLVSGMQTPMAWMMYAFSAIGIGAFLFTRNSNNIRNVKVILKDYLDRFG